MIDKYYILVFDGKSWINDNHFGEYGYDLSEILDYCWGLKNPSRIIDAVTLEVVWDSDWDQMGTNFIKGIVI